MLLEKGAKPDTKEPKGYQTPLHLCGMNGYAKTAAVLLKAKPGIVDAVNKISMTPMLYACSEQHLDLVQVSLIRCIYICACTYFRFEALKALLTH